MKKNIQNPVLKKLCYIAFFLFSFTNISRAQVACGSCTSNDFTFNSFYIGDVNGTAITTSCTVGTPQTAYLWMNVTNSSTRYSLLVYYQLVEHDLMNSTTSTTTVNNCLYDQVAIPQTLINLGTINWTCGNALEITNFQMHWKQNNSISCSFDAPKCLCVANTFIAAPLVVSYNYSSCNNGSTSSVSFTSNVTGGLAPFSYSWSFSNGASSTLANPTLNFNNPGPYTGTLTVTDANSTVSTYTQTINLPSQLTAPTATATQPTCSVSTGSISVSSPTGIGITYSIDGVNYQASTTFSSVASGTYSVTYKNASGCTSAATNVTINTSPSTPAAPTVSVTQPTCSVATGTITVSAPTGAGITYSIDGINYQASTTFSGVASGTYSVTAKSSGGCVSGATSAIVNAQPSTPVAPTVSVTQPTCTMATGTITVSAPTGAGITYSKDGVNYQASTTFSGVTSGTYSITAKNSAGCVSAATSATVNAQPSTPAIPTVSVTQPTCSVATGTITVSAPTGAGITYSKDGVNYQVSSTFSGVTSGTYSITAKSSAGCVSTATSATVNAQPSTPAAPTASVTQPTCSVATGTITISAPIGAGITYSIDGVNYQASTTFSGVTSGTYSVTAKSSTGCVSNVTSVTINAQPSTPSTPGISAGGPTTFCSGGNVVLTSSSGTGNQWYLNGVLIPGATNQTLTVSNSGSYTVVVTSIAGCSSAPSAATVVMVNSNPVVSAISGSSPLCENVSTTYTSATAGGVWSSSNNAIATINSVSGVVTGVSAGTTTINYTVTNGFGCSATVSKSITVVIAPTATVTASGNTTTCAGGGFFLTSSSGLTYQWYLNGVVIAGATSQTYIPTQTGNYNVEITYSSGCTSSSAPVSVTIVTITATTITATGPTTICNTGSVQLCPAVWGWSNYQWYLNGVAIAAPAGVMSCMTVNTGGTYTLSVQNGAGCWSDQSAPINVSIIAAPAAPTISAGGPTTFCGGGSVVLSSSAVSGNQWYLNGNIISGATGQNYTATQAGVYTVTTSNGGCESAQSSGITVSVSNAIAPSLSSPATDLCAGSIVITSSLSTGNQWYLNGVLIPGATNQTYTATSPGVYTVINTQGGCSINSSNSITITASTISPTTIAANYGTVICVGGSVQLCPAVWGWSNYQWYLNGVAIAAPLGTMSCIDVSVAGSYTLDVQNGSGCWSGQSAAVATTIGGPCTVTSGGGGGVESKTLGDIMSQRLYGNAKNSKPNLDAIKEGIVFNSPTHVVNGTNDITLASITPASVINTNASYVSTPTDLINFTNAIEALAVDYTKNGKVLAVSFATKTLGNVYTHTKPICDRLKGAVLLEVKNIVVNGLSLIAYKVRQRTGETEYVINLSAGTETSRNTINLQSNWFTNSYLTDEKLYNFQLWAVSYDMVTSMAKDIIVKLQSQGSLNMINSTDLPKTYISRGNRVGTNLNLTITNNSTATSGYLEIKEKANENSLIVSRQIPFSLLPMKQSQVQIPVKDSYEGDLYVYVNNKLTDLVYSADGAWGIDYDKQVTTINQFSVFNELNPIVLNNDYRLMRNVQVSGQVKDYITIYKTLTGGGLEENLSNYKSLAFNIDASGTGKVNVKLIKKSISNYNDQYTYSFNLSGNKDYVINLNQFKSANTTEIIKPNDITAVSFSFNANVNAPANLMAYIENVRFTSNGSTANQSTDNVVKVYPNPLNGKFIASFNSIEAMPVIIKITESSTGKVVKTQFINSAKGLNKISVDMTNVKTLSNGLYILSLEAEGVKYNPTKLLINK